MESNETTDSISYKLKNGKKVYKETELRTTARGLATGVVQFGKEFASSY